MLVVVFVEVVELVTAVVEVEVNVEVVVDVEVELDDTKLVTVNCPGLTED
jgi:hypothetical protein